MSPDERQRMATCQLADYDAKTPGRRSCPPSRLTFAQAYAVQAEVGRLRERRGERIIGYKVGCTSKPIQEQLRMQEPIFGRIFDTGCFRSGASLSLRLRQSRRGGRVGGAARQRFVRAGRFGAGVPGGDRSRLSRDRAAPLCRSPGLVSRAVVDRERRHARGIRVRGAGARRLRRGELRAQPEHPHQRGRWSRPWKIPRRSSAPSNRCVG